MISAETERQLNDLLLLQNSYQPNAAIKEQLAQKAIVMLVGATCEGKSTAMHAAVALDKRFGTTGNFTSRAPREDDIHSYTYYEHTDEGLTPILARIHNNEVVQYAINPFTKQIYGTEVEDYKASYNVKDVFASAVDSFRQLGFGKTKVITVISETESWLRRFEERFPPGDERRTARRDEAIQSFEWSLEQPVGKHFWVENIDGKADYAGREIIAITLGTSLGHSQARKYAEASLAAASKIII